MVKLTHPQTFDCNVCVTMVEFLLNPTNKWMTMHLDAHEWLFFLSFSSVVVKCGCVNVFNSFRENRIFIENVKCKKAYIIIIRCRYTNKQIHSEIEFEMFLPFEILKMNLIAFAVFEFEVFICIDAFATYIYTHFQFWWWVNTLIRSSLFSLMSVGILWAYFCVSVTSFIKHEWIEINLSTFYLQRECERTKERDNGRMKVRNSLNQRARETESKRDNETARERDEATESKKITIHFEHPGMTRG